MAYVMLYVTTRSSADADKPRDAFRGQSRSPNIAPFHIVDIFLLVCNSNFVFKTSSFQIFDVKNVVTLKSGSEVSQGHSK